MGLSPAKTNVAAHYTDFVRLYPMNFELQKGGKFVNTQELTKVSDWGDKSVRNRFERCSQRPRRGEAHDVPNN
ncbi:hypothetical protein BSPA111_40550 [Buttiauxella sp. A111]|nr:hypothetical protein BSPA111_40550 [Buttiauxella sp. A111]